MTILIAACVGVGFGGLVWFGVLVLRWTRRNRAEAAAMMTGTYLQNLPAGWAPPSVTSVSDWLGEALDRWCDDVKDSGGDGASATACGAWSEAAHHSACQSEGSGVCGG